MFYGSVSSTVAKLPAGAEGTVLTISGGLPSWQPEDIPNTYLASEQGLHLATSTNTFSLVLDGTSLTQTSSGLRLSPAYPGQTSINTVGTISTGHWSGDTISALRGGTGNSSYTAGDILYATATAGIAKLPIGSNGTVLKVLNGLPSWGTDNVGPSYLASEQGLHLSTTTNTFLVALDGTSLTQSSSGLRVSASYPGQTSINTLGTITAGHWSGDPIDVSSGGIGITATPNNGEIPMGNGAGYTLGNITGSEGVTVTNGTGTVNVSLSVATIPTVTSPVSNDYLPIYASGTLLRKKISYADLFASVLGSLNYQGTWDASVNNPTLTDADCTTTDKGRYFVVSSSGTTTLGGISVWNNSDWVVCNGTVWEKTNNTNSVVSVFGRTGTITAQGGDYNALQITNIPAGSLTAINVQDALNELATEKEPTIATGTTAEYYRGDKTWQTLDTAAVAENPSALYYTDARARAAVNGNADGLSYDNVSGMLSLATGRSIPYTASTTNWETAYGWGNHASAGYLTGLEGDGTTLGSGLAGLTLKTVNSNVGTFGSPTNSVSFTVNEKGLITAASSSAMVIDESDVIGLTTDLANKLTSSLTSGNIFVGNSSNVGTGRTLSLSPTSGIFGLSNTGVLTLPDSDSATRGLLTSADWTTFNGKQAALGFTPENNANKSTDISIDGTSDTKYPTAKAVKTYADNLALGFSWKQPIEILNLVGETSTPVTNPNNYDEYIVSPGGDWTSINPTLAPGDLVQYQSSSWVKIKSLATGDRLGIGFKSTTTPSGPFTGKKNYIVTFDSTLNGGNYTYTSSAPANNDAVYVQNANAYYHDFSLVYSTSLSEWVQLSATANFTFGNGLSLTGSNVSLGALTADWNQTGNYAMTTAGDINLNSGNLNTASSTANLFNSNASTLNIGGAASLINFGAAGATLRGQGAFNITTASSSNLNIDPGTTGALNLGTGNDAKTINIGTGNAGNTINIGTSAVGTDTIAIGSPNDFFTLTSSGLNISELGALTGVSSIDGISFSSTTIGFSGIGDILSSGINSLTLDSGTTGALNIGTGNHSKDISIGTGNAGNNIFIATNNTTPDTIQIGSSNDTFSLSSSGFNVTTGGALSGVTAINGASISSSTITFSASGTILTTGANALTLDSGTTGAVDIATGVNAKTVNIATNNGGNIVNIGTGNTVIDTINIGSSLDTLTLSSSGFNVSALGALTGVSSLNTLTLATNTIAFLGAGTINSGSGTTLTLDAGTNGNVDIGTGAFARTISIGNNTGASALILDAGTGNISIGTSSPARLITIGGTGANTIALGNAQTGGSISLGAAMTTGSINIGGTGAQTGNIDIGAGTGNQTLNLGTGNTGNKTINIGTGDGATNTINIATNVAGVDVLNIGTAADQFTLTSAGLNVTAGGALTGVSSLNTLTLATNTIAFLGAGTINSGSGTTLTLDAGTNGNVDIGTGAFARTISIGNNTGASALILDAGTGNISIGTSSPARLITIGGTGANTIALGNAQTGGSISLGAAMTTGSINIGGTGAQTGNIDIGAGTGNQTLNLGTGNTGNKTINIGTGDGATNTINIATNVAGVDVLNIGTAADQFTLTSAGLNVTAGGALSGVTSLDGIAISSSSLSFAGAGSIISEASNTLTIDSGTTGTLDFGTGNHAKTLNIATGNAGNVINIATDNTATDTITIGSSKDTFTLSSSGFNVSSSGVLTGVSALNGLVLNSAGLTFSATGTISTTGSNALYVDSGTTGSVNLGAGNDAKAINIGTGTGGNTIHIGTDNTTQDIIAIGSPLDSFSISSNGFNVSTAGALSGFTTLNTITLNPTAITFAATGSLKSTGANALTIDSGTFGTVNLGTGNNAKTINLGTGNAGDIINIGTDNTVADAITIGSALDALALNSSGLNVSTLGALTGVSSIDTIGVSASALTFPGAASITSHDGLTLTLDSGTSGSIDIGASAFSKSITIGNGTGTSSVSILAGAGNIDIGANAIGRTINLGTGAGVPELINIGGTGANTIALGNTQTAGAVNIGNAMTTGAITIGGTGAQTGSITIGGGTGAQTLNLGTGGTGSKTINIGTGAIANTLTIGNTTASTQLTLRAATGGIVINGLAAAANGNRSICYNPTTNIIYAGASRSNCDPSSARFKHNIEDLKLGLDAVMALRPVSYNYNSDNSSSLGFIAEEAAAIDERLIVRDELGRPSAINPDQFVPIITKGLQDMNNKFDQFISQSSITMGALNQLALSGALHVEGPVELGKDSVGEAVIRAGADHITINFDNVYTYMPVVTISKMTRGRLNDYYIDGVSRDGFTIKIDPTSINDMEFSWHAFAAPKSLRTFSDGNVEDINSTSTSILDVSHFIETVTSIPTNTNDTQNTATATDTATTTTDSTTTTASSMESVTPSDPTVSSTTPQDQSQSESTSTPVTTTPTQGEQIPTDSSSTDTPAVTTNDAATSTTQ